jgi:hypothetical protein
MTENTLCLCYKEQLFRKITAVDCEKYMKNIVKKCAEFLIVNSGVACICYCGFNTGLMAQRKFVILNYKR